MGVVPFVHVALLLANGRDFVFVVISEIVVAWTGEGRGDTVWVFVACGDTAGELSLPMSDFLNQDGLEDSDGLSVASLCDLDSMLECFLPRTRAVDDFGRNGSTASAK